MDKRTGCSAGCQGQQMVCYRCNLAWDIDDPEPPECVRSPEHDKSMKDIKEVLKDEKQGTD